MGTVLIDNARANESISSTGDAADNLSTRIGNGMKKVAEVGAVIAGATIAGATALSGIAMKSAETADRVDKLSAKIGISKQSFQEWDYILGQNGMDAEKLQVGVKTLVSQMDAAASGSANATEAFGKLGLKWTDNTGKLKSQEVMMNEAIMALANMQNGTEKARLATELFGKAGIEMMPMLNNGAQGITDLKDRAHELGLILSDETVNAGVVLGDTMDDVKDSFGAIVTKIGAEVMPVVQAFLDQVIQNMPQIQSVAEIAFTVISAVLGFVIDNLNILLPILGAAVAGFAAFQIATAVAGFIAAYQTAVAGATTATGIFNAVLAANPIGLIALGVAALIGLIIALALNWDKVSAAMSAAWDAIKDLASNMVNGIKDAFSNMWGTIKGFWDDVVDWFKSIPKKMEDFGKKIITGLWDGIKNIFGKVSTWINEKVDWVKDKLMFWKDSNDEMSTTNAKSPSNSAYKVNGSHANGLDYVPFDGYMAEVHEGEAILKKQDASNWRNGGASSMDETNILLRTLISKVTSFEQTTANLPRTTNYLNRGGNLGGAM
jgi:hypothetical protein